MVATNKLRAARASTVTDEEENDESVLPDGSLCLYIKTQSDYVKFVASLVKTECYLEKEIVLEIPASLATIGGWMWEIYDRVNAFGFLSPDMRKIWVVINNSVLFIYDSPVTLVVRRIVDVRSIVSKKRICFSKMGLKVAGLSLRVQHFSAASSALRKETTGSL